MEQKLLIYNTLTRTKERFTPLHAPNVGMYVCGPTVYGDPHLGHARPAITFDILFRYLKHLGYKVRYVRNITDVGHLEHDADEGDDKIEKKARLEQLEAFEEQVKWSVETQLPLMIHCRKAQNEMVHLLRKYEKELPGGVFHCFTGNQKEAEELLSFDKFVLGIGGVSTFKSSHLREDLPAVVPMNRIVLETDSPYMAPVPYRGKRNESAFVVEVMKTLAKAYGVSEEEFARQTNLNAERVFPLSVSPV